MEPFEVPGAKHLGGQRGELVYPGIVLARRFPGPRVGPGATRSGGPDGGFGQRAVLVLEDLGRGRADLPAELQNITVYSAARFADAKPEAAAFCALLASPEGKAAMVAKGVK